MALTHRQRILNTLSGNGGRNDHPPYYPDLSYYFDINKRRGSMEAAYADCRALLDLHHRMNVGLPVHLYVETYKVVYEDSIRIERQELPDGYIQTTTTPVGRLTQRERALMKDEHPFRVEHAVKTADDLKVVEYMFTHRRLVPTYEKVKEAIDAMGGYGFVDLVLPRSPLPHLLIDLAGMEAGLFLMTDHPEECEHFFQVCSEANDVAFDIMADCPYGTVCIFGDNIDEVIVSPSMFRRYSLPYYQRRCERLHRGGKLVSAHMDGRLKGLLGMMKDTCLDIFDGATPEPMNDWTLEEMARALGSDQRLWCGVPATLFCDATTVQQVKDFSRRILDAFGPKVVLNVGDQLPPDGDLARVAASAEVAAEYRL
jgi:uroporphyrinogen-III decarboxylase